RTRSPPTSARSRRPQASSRTRSRPGESPSRGKHDVSAWRSRSTAGNVRPDMNVTPLVDVVLVLLIIFKVVAPRLDQDVQVNLPGIFNPDPDVDASVEPLKVSVAKAGEYYIDDRKYDLDGAIETLSVAHATDPLRRLVLRAD